EQVSVLEDGSLLWRAQIAEPTEMLPWIRGWGADVEVLAPDWLRERMREEAERTYKLYHQGQGGDYD
ncbi:MAG: WYL domain-containing protein, partial [Anaerolineales bacterium]|nr:WYL domain-containing protein [Anaerolineales bacterium]